MTAAHGRPLRVVPDPGDTVEEPSTAPVGAHCPDVAEPETWEAQQVFDQWDPEHQLIGALMWLSAGRARPILELVPDTAIWRPTIRWAYQIIRSLVDEGCDPGPVVVLATARRQPCTQAIDPQQPPTPGRHHRLAVYLANAYTQTVSPAAAATYARQVLDEAYRRAFRTNGIRMQQLGECGADREDLTEQFGAIRDELSELWRRCETASKPGWDKP